MQVCITKQRISSFRFRWVIKGFSSFLRDRNSSKVSTMFSMRGESPGQWMLQLYNKSYGNGPPNYISCYMLFTLTPDYVVQVIKSWQIVIEASDGAHYVVEQNKAEFSFHQAVYGSHRLISIEQLRNRPDLLPNDTLTLICEGDYEMDLVNSFESGMDIEPSRLSRDLSLVFDRVDADVKLISEGKTVLAHKLILSARSSVFAAMFQHDMLENSSSKVMISDVGLEVLQEVVNYIYSDLEPAKMATLAEGILVAAEKYDLSRLKTMCESHLFAALDVDNVISTLQLAFDHNAMQLKRMCLNFAVVQLGKLMKSPT